MFYYTPDRRDDRLLRIRINEIAKHELDMVLGVYIFC